MYKMIRSFLQIGGENECKFSYITEQWNVYHIYTYRLLLQRSSYIYLGKIIFFRM